jgi:hypothetical protein
MLKENSVAESTRPTTFSYFHVGCDIHTVLFTKQVLPADFLYKEVTNC